MNMSKIAQAGFVGLLTFVGTFLVASVVLRDTRDDEYTLPIAIVVAALVFLYKLSRDK